MPDQTQTGKAFEYALLQAFYERLSPVTPTYIIDSAPYRTALRCFELFGSVQQGAYRIVASAAVNFLLDIEPRLSQATSEQDTLQLDIVSDARGQSGDVRDVLAIRRLQHWEIGISAKNNHRAVKHQRLSNTIDFGQKWMGVPCSRQYFDEIRPVFDSLDKLSRESLRRKTWASLGDYHPTVYIPILTAFRDELRRMEQAHGNIVAERLVQYLIGNKDFYKVIKGNNSVEIQAYNINGTLNQPAGKVKPKAQLNRLRLPNRMIEVVFDGDSKTTLLVSLNEGWQIAFRIHNASSRIEPSLKFDVNLVSAPHTLFTNHIFIGEV
ncbi:MAG: HaeIII family restriction endonuclease [Pseudobdellovibrionaceae bacterium]